jgi:hypothetical protein
MYLKIDDQKSLEFCCIRSLDILHSGHVCNHSTQ